MNTCQNVLRQVERDLGQLRTDIACGATEQEIYDRVAAIVQYVEDFQSKPTAETPGAPPQ